MEIVVITGASAGLGTEFLAQLMKTTPLPDEIWLIARREERLQQLAAAYPHMTFRILPFDLQQDESYDQYGHLLAESGATVRLLINNAGYGKLGEFAGAHVGEQTGMVDLNCRALTAVTMETLPYMTQGSRIVMVDSLSAFQPVPYMAVYGATKAYVLSYSRALNAELAPRGIRIMAVSPGWVKTDFFDRAEADRTKPVVSYMNVLWEPADVVKTAIRDLYHSKKDVSIHGFPVKAQVLGVKLLPHKLIMKIWMKQQKLPPKNRESNQRVL